MTVTVTPDTFVMVLFEHDPIVATAEKVADQIGLSDVDISVTIDEAMPLARVHVTSVDPVEIAVEGGAFEDPRHPRQLSEEAVADTLGRLLFQVRDRRAPDFGEPPPESDLSLAHKVAWDTYAVGRLARLGYDGRRQVRLYAFRNRHGFTDAADAAFETLWTADGLSWDELTTISDDALAQRPA